MRIVSKDLRKFGAKSKLQRHCVNSHHIEDVIGILLYNRFMELPGSNQTLGASQELFYLPWACQAGRKEHAT